MDYPVSRGSISRTTIYNVPKNNQKWYCGTEQCPMCRHFQKTFHCQNCVSTGDFGHSLIDKGKFSKKQLKYNSIVYSCESLKTDCTRIYSKKHHIILKKNETSILQEKIRLLKLSISDKNKAIVDKKSLLKKLKVEIDSQKSRVDRYGRRVVRLEDFTKSQEVILNEKIDKLLTIRPDLKNVIRARIKQLVTHIFYLNEVQPIVSQNEELGSNNSLSNALAEASQLTYVCGQWVDTCEEWSRQTELAYQIVAPTLPANGDYSSYYEWVSDKNKDYAFNQTFAEPNPACTISAALTYTSQLVKQLSFFLDIFLPRRQNISEFCGNELNEIKFSKYVTHLNANILYLCFSQNVNPNLLHPDYTLKNLLQLLNTNISDLGRVEPANIDKKICSILEEKIAVQLYSFSGDSDSEDDNYYEWEAVPNVEYPADHNQISLQSTSSVVRAGLVASTAASLASMWRGWTTNR
ncbi:beclin 1-associated autophagy-related key regulator [Adelges cooleyi]|uniref:beclin 1-associated autophagy-related key regulator n=1 Tax=Adelges cooleyi TaxID=133065 RepID=UPI00217F4AF2|nr:beclin 1-associated autophagy-related key regulator [Adelges cooleyi]